MGTTVKEYCRKYGAKGLVFGLLTFSLVLLAQNTTRSADDEDKKAAAEAQKAALELAAGKGNAKELAQKHSLDHVMRGFKLKNKGGIGVEGVPVSGQNGIEAKIISLARKELAKGDLTKEADALARMSEITRAIGEISSYNKVKKGQAKWDKFNKDMLESNESLIKAIKAGDPKAVKTAAGKLNQSCNECHGEFRDNN